MKCFKAILRLKLDDKEYTWFLNHRLTSDIVQYLITEWLLRVRSVNNKTDFTYIVNTCMIVAI